MYVSLFNEVFKIKASLTKNTCGPASHRTQNQHTSRNIQHSKQLKREREEEKKKKKVICITVSLKSELIRYTQLERISPLLPVLVLKPHQPLSFSSV